VISKEEENFRGMLEVLRKDQREASQFFYASIATHNLASKSKEVADALNENPLYWNTVLGSLETSFFIALNRIFDNKSRHNIQKLIAFLKANSEELLSPGALEARKMEGVRQQGGSETPAWLPKYIDSANYPDDKYFLRLERYVNKYKKIYTDNYAKIRHEVLAHNVTVRRVEVSKLYMKTNVRVVSRILSFVDAAYEYIWQMAWNGRRVSLRLHRPNRVLSKLLDGSLPSSGSVESLISEQALKVMEAICH